MSYGNESNRNSIPNEESDAYDIYQQQANYEPPADPYGQAPYGQAPYGQAPYGQAPYGQTPYGQGGPYGAYGAGQAAASGAATGGAYYGAPETGYYQGGPNGYYRGAQVSQKSALIAGILGILLGIFGVHNFYVGRTSIGVAQLLITLLSLGILSFVSAIWGLIEGILFLVSDDPKWRYDAEGILLKR